MHARSDIEREEFSRKKKEISKQLVIVEIHFQYSLIFKVFEKNCFLIMFMRRSRFFIS